MDGEFDFVPDGSTPIDKREEDLQGQIDELDN